MRFKLIDEAKKQFPVHRLCNVLGVSESGFFAWKRRGVSQRQLDDMVLLAHTRSQFALSHETYGSPRMHVELCEDGVPVGRHRVSRLKKDLAITALKRAIATRQPPRDLIHHSDRGSQYCSHGYRKLLAANGMLSSMSGRGNCYDNAMVETVFKTIKSELVWRTSFQTRQQAKNALGRYIDGFCNPRRRHSALGYKLPIKFEAEMTITE